MHELKPLSATQKDRIIPFIEEMQLEIGNHFDLSFGFVAESGDELEIIIKCYYESKDESRFMSVRLTGKGEDVMAEINLYEDQYEPCNIEAAWRWLFFAFTS